MQNVFLLKFHYRPKKDPVNPRVMSDLLLKIDGVTRVDLNAKKHIGRCISKKPLDFSHVAFLLEKEGFVIVDASEKFQDKEVIFSIDGMTCNSCEVLIESRLGKIEGVKRVEANASRGQVKVISCVEALDMNALQDCIKEHGYTIRTNRTTNYQLPTTNYTLRPSLIRLAGIFLIVLALGFIASKFNILTPTVSLGQTVSVGAAFLIGLVAASSSCIAVTGGVLLSLLAQHKKRMIEQGKTYRITPTLFSFVLGRIVSYVLLGGLIGLIGKSIAVSPLVTGSITLIAAVYMLVMGLDMLSLTPAWLKRMTPRMPKIISSRILAFEKHSNAFIPFLLGAGTFFLPCGFTQSLQLYALTTGSALTSGLLLGIFALGTIPALLIIGYASHSLKGKAGAFFYQFAGGLVLLLGLWNISNGFTTIGYPLPTVSEIVQAFSQNNQQGKARLVPYDGNVQTISMQVQDEGYAPNTFVIRQGVPTKWIVDAQDSGGCLSVLVARKLGVQKLLERGKNVIEFTPQETGPVAFSCSMGMFRGQINVVPNT